VAAEKRTLGKVVRYLLAVVALLVTGLISAVGSPRSTASGIPFSTDFVAIEQIAPNVTSAQPRPTGSVGTFTSACGTNAERHRNADSFVLSPGQPNGAHHVHDYVGNLSTDAYSTPQSLAAAGTTCTNGDKSAYFWPVLRNTHAAGPDASAPGGGLDGNFGEIVRPITVQLEFRGNPSERVTAMPEGLALVTGDAKAATNGGAHANAAWTCTGFEDRATRKYPLCPPGSRLVRIYDFPSCWDGKNLHPDGHRASHVVFPAQDGSCGQGRIVIPQLRMTVIYERPVGRGFALDSFPEQLHNPVTDHGFFVNVMPAPLMAQAVDCINTGQRC
jgi:hypothetical protein